jgi:hypothetical protein
MRHGVPELDEERMMIGFRNFDFNPYYFERDPEDKTGFTELHDEINPGWVRPISSDESIEIQKEFRLKWKSGLSKTQLKKPAAF